MKNAQKEQNVKSEQKRYVPLTLFFKDRDTKNICRKYIDHLKFKTGLSQDNILMQALQEFNMQFDEKGNRA